VSNQHRNIQYRNNNRQKSIWQCTPDSQWTYPVQISRTRIDRWGVNSRLWTRLFKPLLKTSL